MALLERVATLIRANLNDMVDRAENPEKMIKQVVLDMQNQYIQVKTQVAIALADLHLLEKKQKENQALEADWMNKANLAVGKQDDRLARAALDRAMTNKQMAASFVEQIEDQRSQVDVLREALDALAQKIREAEAQAELLLARHRRSRAVSRAAAAASEPDSAQQTAGAFQRMNHKVLHAEATAQAAVELSGDDLERRFARLERDQQIDRMLEELKQRKGLPSA
ncbi:MAG: PspA/IM30 family protein [Acidobacteriota bacterium]|nr:PspA/IM30 family protein [Acidobacteriota bacterium]